MRRLIWAFGLAAACTLTVAQAQAPAEFAQRRGVVVAGEGLQALQLDEAVYRAAQTPDLRDVRLFNAAGEALPWMRLAAPPPPRPAPAALPMVTLPAEALARQDLINDFRLRIEKNGPRATIELTPVPALRTTTAAGQAAAPIRSGGVLLDLRGVRGERGHLALQFAPGAPDFAGRVDLFASEDLVDWRMVTSGPLVVSRQFNAPVERNQFSLAAAPSFLRVQPAQSPDAIGPQLAGASFTAAKGTAEPTRSSLAVTTEAPGVYLVEVPVGLPAARVVVLPQRENTAVRARVLRYEDDPALPRARLGLQPRRAPERWVPVAVINVFRLVRDGAVIETPPLPLPARTTALKIELLDGDSLGDEAPMVLAEWQPERIAFAARGPGPYILAVGLADAKPGPQLASEVLPPDDPAGARLPLARLDPLAPAIAGPTKFADPAAVATMPGKASAPRLLLWGLLLGAVVVLAAMAWQLGRQLKRAPANDAARGAERSDQAS